MPSWDEKEKPVTCGMLIFSEERMLIVRSADSGGRWDIPKGIKEENETDQEAAIRECKEETGLDVSALAGNMKDLGRMSYLAKKDLHMFAVAYPGKIDVAALKCESFTKDDKGNLKPEVDGFELVDPFRAPDRLGRTLSGILMEMWPSLLPEIGVEHPLVTPTPATGW